MSVVLAVALGLFDRRSGQASGTVVALEAVGTTPSGFSEIGKTYRLSAVLFVVPT